MPVNTEILHMLVGELDPGDELNDLFRASDALMLLYPPDSVLAVTNLMLDFLNAETCDASIH